jgi:mRNA interferase HigB
LIKKQTLIDYALENAQSRIPLSAWVLKLKYANWETPLDIKDTYNSADLLGNGTDRVVFDFGGNNYRIICKYYFGEKDAHLFIYWIGTHKQYDVICNQNEQYTIKIY